MTHGHTPPRTALQAECSEDDTSIEKISVKTGCRPGYSVHLLYGYNSAFPQTLFFKYDRLYPCSDSLGLDKNRFWDQLMALVSSPTGKVGTPESAIAAPQTAQPGGPPRLSGSVQTCMSSLWRSWDAIPSSFSNHKSYFLLKVWQYVTTGLKTLLPI